MGKMPNEGESMKTIRLLPAILGLFLTNCAKDAASYSILPTGQSFQQSAAQAVNDKMDILWVIDDSASMQPLQTNLTNNFNSFITQFVTKGYDFHMAVTDTAAYLAGASYFNNPSYARFKDGTGANVTNVYDILPTTPNLASVFVKNASLGATGNGDERAFSSFKAALDSPQNAGFLRSNSYLAIIILSDEDDFSSTKALYARDHDYTDPGLVPVQTYVDYLDGLTASTGATRRYNVSSIAVLDNTCLQAHVAQSSSSIIGQRYIQLSNATGGSLGSICDSSYANTLNTIQQNIIELGTQYYLSRVPVVSTIQVIVNGATIPQDGTNGWSYASASNSILFHGNAVPPASAEIQVNFDPVTLTF